VARFDAGIVMADPEWRQSETKAPVVIPAKAGI
jgi:hypothetical protein